MRYGSMDSYTQGKYDQYDAQQQLLLDEQEANRPMTRDEHREFFAAKLAANDERWQKDFRNAAEQHDTTRIFHGLALRAIARNEHVESVLYLKSAVRAAADWFYEENRGQPF